MATVQAAAGERYVEITLEEMETFLERAYHPLHPRKGRKGNEFYFDLSLSDNHAIFVRVYSAILTGSGVGRGTGSDSIKVVLLSDRGNALAPKAKIVKRTKNWRTAIQDRVEDYLEAYESKVDYWKKRRLMLDDGRRPPEDALDSAVKESLPPMSRQERRELDDARAEIEEEGRNSEVPRGTMPSPSMPSVKKTKPGVGFEGNYRSIGPGDWGVQIWSKGSPGLEGVAITKGGQRRKIRLVERVKAFKDQYKNNAESEIWRFEDVNGRARQQGYGGGRWAADDALVESVATRYLNA